MERVRQLHDQGFEHEMCLHHYQSLMEQMVSQLSATHLEMHRARDLIEDAMVSQDHRLDATVKLREKAVLAPRRMEQPKPRTQENTRKKTHPPKRVTFGTLEKDGPSTRALPTPSPQDPFEEYVQQYGYYDWKAEVNENLGWLTARGKDMRARLEYQAELKTDMSGQLHEMEQDIMLNHDKTVTAMREARAAKAQNRVAIAVALVVSIARILFQLYR
ncbi:hypothetical protein L1987_58084 [Smallanthus sonchifolius]|uniref:Uncharacterized protein n=1 Tax=Smallanthus sonchifolius TaxID=185202 RepID=A0ACB9DEZ1_9ASTR|nr:hypothetical protein L1987_58084 [Smallanthus sonchifolius]